jgi:hypothetical protein
MGGFEGRQSRRSLGPPGGEASEVKYGTAQAAHRGGGGRGGKRRALLVSSERERRRRDREGGGSEGQKWSGWG